ncbi:MAG: hypothetical protein QN163_03510 [Armatimonadota bacterium]|nr:hypothetical protein [Armatimonadota bacterium]MDR5697303.1 hypothetical protein [Armatimonadota bacterium]
MSWPAPIRVRFTVCPDRLEIRVAYAGSALSSPDHPELGLVLMRVLMDEVRTLAEGSEQVTLLPKRIGG